MDDGDETGPFRAAIARAHAAWPAGWVPAAAFVEHLRRTILVEVDAHVVRFDASPAFKDEVRQALAARLLVAPPGEAPPIADYAGRAPLSAWVRIAAICTVLNLRRGKAGEVERAAARKSREIDELAGAGADDIELDVI